MFYTGHLELAKLNKNHINTYKSKIYWLKRKRNKPRQNQFPESAVT